MTLNAWKALVRDRLGPALDGRTDTEFVDELAAHLSQVYEQARLDGGSDEDARSAALALI